jgi:hypothetical protein
MGANNNNPCISYNDAKMLLKQAHRKIWQQKKGVHSCNTILQLSRKEATTPDKNEPSK